MGLELVKVSVKPTGSRRRGHVRGVRRALRAARAILARQPQEIVQMHVDASNPQVTVAALCRWRSTLRAARWRAGPAHVQQSLFDRRDNRGHDRHDRQRQEDFDDPGEVEPAFHAVPAHPTGQCPSAATQRANCQPEPDNN